MFFVQRFEGVKSGYLMPNDYLVVEAYNKMDTNEVQRLEIGDKLIYVKSNSSPIWTIVDIQKNQIRIESPQKENQKRIIDKKCLKYWVKLEGPKGLNTSIN